MRNVFRRFSPAVDRPVLCKSGKIILVPGCPNVTITPTDVILFNPITGLYRYRSNIRIFYPNHSPFQQYWFTWEDPGTSTPSLVINGALSPSIIYRFFTNRVVWFRYRFGLMGPPLCTHYYVFPNVTGV